MAGKTHDALVTLGLHLNYPIDKEGICMGVSVAWISACMIGEEAAFKHRVSNVLKSKPDELSANILTAKMQNAKGEDLSARQQDLIDILAFYEMVHLHQSPIQLKEWFSASYQQSNIDDISKLSSSLKMQSKGGLLTVHHDSAIYSQAQLFDYLTAVTNGLNSLSYQNDTQIGFILNGLTQHGGHVVGLAYDTKNAQWKYFDINYGVPKVYTIEQLAKKIHQLYRADMDESMLSIRVMTTQNDHNKDKLKKVLGTLKENHGVNKDTIHSVRLGDLMVQAAMMGQTEILQSLAHYDVDFNQKNQQGLSPIMMAAIVNQPNVISMLSAMADVVCNAQTQGDIAPAHIAAMFDYADVIRALSIHPTIDFTQECEAGTPATIAAHEGHTLVIDALFEAGVDLSQPNNKGDTPLQIASKNNDFKMIKCLLAHIKPNVSSFKEKLRSLQDIESQGSNEQIFNHD